jgi:predicted Mrr-cat superfamily restriction endonuclease
VKVGDLVKYIHEGQRDILLGIVTGEYTAYPDEGPYVVRYKNVMWIGQDGIRPINIKFLEVISESR